MTGHPHDPMTYTAEFREATALLHRAFAAFQAHDVEAGVDLARRARDRYSGHAKEQGDCEQLLGMLHADEPGHESDAVQHYRRAAAIFAELNLSDRVGQTERGLGDLYARLRRWDDAVEAYGDAYRAVHAVAGDDADRWSSCIDYLALGARALSDGGRAEAALEEYLRLRELLVRLADPRLPGCHLDIAHVLGKLGRFEDAYGHLTIARSGFVEQREYRRAVDIDVTMAEVLVAANRYDDADVAAERAHRGYEALRDDEEVTRNRRRRGQIAGLKAEFLHRQQRYAEAAQGHTAAARWFQESGDPQESVRAATRVGEALLKAQDHSQAESVLTLAIGVLRQFGEELEIASCAVNLAIAYSVGQKWDEAESLLHEAREVFARHDQWDHVADCDLNLRGVAESRQRARGHEVTEPGDDGTAVVRRDLAEALRLRDDGRPEDALVVAEAVRDRAPHGHWRAHADLTLGTIRHDLGNHEEAERRYRAAERAFRKRGETELAGICNIELATLFVGCGRHLDAEPCAAAAVSDHRGDPARAAHANLVHASILRELGRYADAAVRVDEAFEVASGRGDAVQAARARHIRGLLHLESGRVAQAVADLEHATGELTQDGEPSHLAACGADLAVAYRRSGRSAEAVALLHRLLDESPVPQLEAMLRLNLGTALCDRGDEAAAVDEFTRARERYRERHHVTGVATCDLNLAELLVRAGRLDEAERSLAAAIEPVRANGDQALLAHTLGARARVSQRRSRFTDAQNDFEEARAIQFALGRLVDVARCDLALAILDRERAITAGEPEFDDELLRRYVPAVLYLDGRRHQFARAADRQAWATQVRGYFGGALEAADRLGDERLMAELIEVAINSGVHTATTGTGPPSVMSVRPTSGVGGADRPALHEPGDPRDAEGSAMSTGGGLSLVASAVLPMRPPPRLVMPGGHLALSPYVELADQRYRPTRRPDPVRVF